MKDNTRRYSTSSILGVATVAMFMIGVGAAAGSVPTVAGVARPADPGMSPATRATSGSNGERQDRGQATPSDDQWQRDIDVRQQIDRPTRNAPWADSASPAEDVGFFYDQLSPYGDWVRHPDYGWVWFPREVGPGWRPYTRGRWLFTDYGWTWISAEPFGWATYHYGRWLADPRIGWVWVPGTDWAPAWVAWQEAVGFVGWAPLPPSVGFQPGMGLQTDGLEMSFGISTLDYSFVDERRFLSQHLEGYLLPAERNFAIMRVSASATSYIVVDHRVVNRGTPIETIERVTRTRGTTRFHVTAATEPGTAQISAGAVSIYRPTDSSLQTVRVARRNNVGFRPGEIFSIAAAEDPLAYASPLRSNGESMNMPVARRTPAAGDDDGLHFRREQSVLRSSQDRDQRALEVIHREELAQWVSRTETQQTSERQAAEAQALREQHRNAERQLEMRQHIRLRAEGAGAATQESPGTTAPGPGDGARPQLD